MRSIHEKHNVEQRTSEPTPSQRNTKLFSRAPEFRLTRILVPTDLTDESRKAVDYALYLTKLVEGELILLHFYDESWRHLSSIGVGRGEAMLEDESKQEGRLYALQTLTDDLTTETLVSISDRRSRRTAN